LIYYRNLAKIEIDSDCNVEACKQCVEACPQKILKLEKNKIQIKDIYKCDSCEACIEVCKQQMDGKSSIKVSKDENLIFFIESWGQIEAKEIFAKAVNTLNNNLKEFDKQVK